MFDSHFSVAALLVQGGTVVLSLSPPRAPSAWGGAHGSVAHRRPCLGMTPTGSRPVTSPSLLFLFPAESLFASVSGEAGRVFGD